MTTSISGTSGVTFPAGGVGNPAGSVVGTTDTQTLTNKTLTSPTMTGAVVSTMASSVITSGTAVASTSGTSIDFTSIPSWVKRITVMFQGVSTNGSSNVQVQIGAGSVTTTGYLHSFANTSNVIATTNFTTGFGISIGDPAAVRHGIITCALLGSNVWICSMVIGRSDAAAGGNGAGYLSLGGTLDRVRITTVNGTDTFDAGSINILYE